MEKRRFDKKNIIYYALCFYPFFGAVIGVVMYAFHEQCMRMDCGQTSYALIGAAFPILFSGARHLKEYMDTADTLLPKAYGSIAGMIYCMAYAGSLAAIRDDRQFMLLGAGYMISRTLYGMAYVWFPEAGTEKKDGAELSLVQKKTLRIILGVILALCFGACLAVSPIMGALEVLLCMWIWTYYYYLSKRAGGVTKQLSGYFLTLCELAVVLLVGMFGRILV